MYLDVATVDGDSYVNAYKHVRIGEGRRAPGGRRHRGYGAGQPTPGKRAPKKERRVLLWRGADVPRTFSVIGHGVAEYEYVLDAAPATYRRDGDARLLAPLEHAYERAYANTLAWFKRAHEKVYGTARGTTLSWKDRRVFLRPDRHAKCVPGVPGALRVRRRTCSRSTAATTTIATTTATTRAPSSFEPRARSSSRCRPPHLPLSPSSPPSASPASRVRGGPFFLPALVRGRAVPVHQGERAIEGERRGAPMSFTA